jgi:hypothetical protein
MNRKSKHFPRHPGEGRDPCLMQLADGAVDPGLRRDVDLVEKIELGSGAFAASTTVLERDRS